MAQKRARTKRKVASRRRRRRGAAIDGRQAALHSKQSYGQLPHLELIYDTAPIGLAFLTPDCHYAHINEHLTEICGIPIADHIGRSVRETVPQVAEQVEQIVQTILRTGEPITGIEVNGQRPDGSNMDRVWITHWHPLKSPGGDVIGINVAAEEITDRKRFETSLATSEKALRELNDTLEQREATRQLLLKELNHRVKNTLAIVQAIVQQTLRSTHDPADFSQRLMGRIQSLARVHSLLTDSEWQGADLRELILDQLLQGPVDETKVTALGPSIQLGSQTTLHMALMLHELGTNSIKYGALSSPGGRVVVEWTADGEKLLLRWVERGGPAISAPIKRSFGTTLIEQSAKSEGGFANMLYDADGIAWEISIALPSPAARAGEAEIVHSASIDQPVQEEGVNGVSRPALEGLRFLVVEDEPLVALDLVGSLEKAGAQVAPPAATDQAALAAIANTNFDGVLLDANLHGRPVDEIAAALEQRNIPYIFVTGYGCESLRGSFERAAILSKPVSDRQLIQAVCDVIRKG
jgi:PAS domain S-box-containing protein